MLIITLLLLSAAVKHFHNREFVTPQGYLCCFGREERFWIECWKHADDMEKLIKQYKLHVYNKKLVRKLT